MKRIIYLGSKPQKADNVAKTGLVWARGEVHEVEDDVQAAKLLEHPHVWADADTDYKLAEIPVEKKPEPKPTVLIAPQGGENVSPYWEPVTIVVPAEVFKALQNKEFVAVFMKPEDADEYAAYKSTKAPELKPATEELNWPADKPEPRVVQPWEMDKRSREFKSWAAQNPDDAAKLKERS